MAKIPSTGGGSKFEYSQIEKDTYEARVVRFVFVGTQPQRPFKGQAKPDALLAKVAFELIGETVEVTNTEDGKVETKPAVVFNDIVVPGGGTGRGHCFDLINAALDAEACFEETDDYKELINAPVSLTVGSYTSTKTGKEVSCVDAVGKMGKKAKEKLADSTVDTLFFCCYTDDEDSKEAYLSIGKFAQDKLAEAKDKEFIPAVSGDWPRTKEEDGEEKDEF